MRNELPRGINQYINLDSRTPIEASKLFDLICAQKHTTSKQMFIFGEAAACLV